jgi:hypothetical protein
MRAFFTTTFSAPVKQAKASSPFTTNGIKADSTPDRSKLTDDRIVNDNTVSADVKPVTITQRQLRKFI